MNRPIARVLSTIFHPLLIPALIALIAVWSNPYSFGGWQYGGFFIVQLLIWTFLIPTIGLALMQNLFFKEAHDIDERAMRILPYFLYMSCFSIGFYAIYKLPIPQVAKGIVGGFILSMTFSFFGNNFLKVSRHSVAMGSLIGALIVILSITTRSLDFAFTLALFVTGFILSARVVLKNYRLSELSISFFIGFFSQLIAFSIFQFFGSIM